MNPFTCAQRLICVMVFLSLATAGHAQDNTERSSDEGDRPADNGDPPASTTEPGEEPIEIVGEAAELAPLESERLLNPVPLTGVERETFKERPSTRRLGDVINRLPGVFMGGPPGENKDIRLRGLDKEFTRFEFDGVQLPGGGEKREFQVNRLSPLLVGELKVIRNPTAEYESDGIAGRVIVEPRPIPEDWRVDLRGGGGVLEGSDTELIEGGVSIGKMLTDRFGFNATFDFTRQPLIKDKVKRKFKDGVLDETEIEEEEKPTDSFNFVLDTVWKYDAGEFHFKPLFFDLEEDKEKEKLKTKPGKDPELELEDEIKEQTTWGVALTNEHTFGNGWRVETEVGYYSTTEDKEKTIPKFKGGGGGFTLDKTELEEEEKEDEFWEIKSKLTVPHQGFVPSELKTGFHLRFRDRFRTKEKIEIKASDGSVSDKGEAKDDYFLEENLLMGFVQNEFFITDRFSVLPGVRVEHTMLDARSGAGGEDDRSFTDVNPSLHLLFRATDTVTFKGAVSRGLNRPKFDEISPFVDEKGDRFVEGNPDIDPARSWNFDVGVEYATPALFLGINLFHKEIEGVIEEVDTGEVRDGKDVFRIENVGDGFLQGIELEQRAQLGELIHPSLSGFSLWANESLFNSELTDQTGRERPFNEQPDVIANFGGDYTFAATKTTFTAAAKFRDELQKFVSDDEREIEDSIWTLDLGVRQQIGENATLVFEAINVTDAEKRKTKLKDGEVEREVESTGRLFFLGFEATF